MAETEHISGAAKSLHLTQAAVTQQVKHFEQALGLKLLERDGRRVRLTDAGRSMAETCRGALRAVEVVDDTAQAAKQLHTGSLHVGASSTCAVYYLPTRLAEFARRHPSVRLQVTIEPSVDLNRRVEAGTLDCAIVGGGAAPGLVSFELARDEVVVVAHRDHPLAQKRRISPADFAQHRYLGRAPQLSTGRTLRDILGDAYEQVDSLNLGHSEYIRAAALAGLGFGVLSRRAVAAELASGLLKRLPVQPIVRPINVVRRQGRGGPTLEVFWTMLTSSDGGSSGKMPPNGGATA